MARAAKVFLVVINDFEYENDVLVSAFSTRKKATAYAAKWAKDRWIQSESPECIPDDPIELLDQFDLLFVENVNISILERAVR